MKYTSDGKKIYKLKIIKYFNLIEEKINKNNYNNIIKKYKENKIIPKHFDVSLNIVNKYFGNINNLKLESTHG